MEYLAKPATMILLMAWFVSNGGLQGWLSWFFLGALLSLAGDVFLMLPRDRFIFGLGFFLLAHIAYIIGFNPTLPPAHPLTLVLAAILATLNIFLFRKLARTLEYKTQRWLKWPVLAYSLVLSLMVLSAAACLTRPTWQTIPAAMATLGAVSFMFSDCLLAWNKFFTPLRWGHPVVLAAYHIGQAGILTAALLSYSLL